MTITNSTIRSSTNGDGTTTEFAVSFPFYDETELVVILIEADGTEVTQSLTTHYTVSGGDGTTGTITMVTAPAVGERLVRYRSSPLTQETDYADGDAFPADSHEAALDRLTMQNQEQADRLARALTLSESTEVVGSLTMEEPVAGRALQWNSTENGIENSSSNLETLEANVAADAAQTALDRIATAADVVATNANVVSAAASASAALIAAASNLYSSVENKSADFSVTSADDGKMFVVDTSGGDVEVTMPDIATDVSEGFRVAFAKSDVANTLTINRANEDTINGQTSYIMTGDTEVATMVADENSPDNWFVFGASTTLAGQGLTKDGATISLAGGVAIDIDGNVSGHGAVIVTDATGTRTLSADDNGKIIRMTHASANAVTLPETSTEAIPTGFQCMIVQSGAGAMTVDTEGTDTNNGAAMQLTAAAQYSPMTVLKVVAGSPNAYETFGAFS